MHKTAITSVDAHRDEIISGRKQNRETRIYHWLCKYSTFSKGYTRNEIAEYMKMRLSSVCGGMDVLIKSGLVREIEPRPDKFTNKKGKPVVAIDPTKPRIRPAIQEAFDGFSDR